MEELHVVTIDSTTYEIVVSGTAPMYVGWALVVRPDGRRDLLSDRLGAPFRESGPSSADIEARLQDRLRATFGRTT